jgi:hypothetical protein
MRWALAAVVVASAAGCVLLVPARDDLSGSCHFAGESTTSCGKCIQRSCQNEVNGCCRDSTCDKTLQELDTCAVSGSADACAPLLQSTQAGLGGCVSSHCSDPCSGAAEAGSDASGPCTLDDVAQTSCGACLQKNCVGDLTTCCNDPAGYCANHVASVRACASSPSAASCARLNPNNPYVPDAGAALNTCAATHCASACPLNGPIKCPGNADCIACCFNAFQKGHDDSFDFDTACACPPGGCTFECEQTAYCKASAPTPGDACLTCLSDGEGWGGRCKFAEQCYADIDCINFTTCYQQCHGP